MVIKDGVLINVSEDAVVNNHFTVPAGIKTIGRLAFGNCKNLMTITIPDSVERIEDDAFFNCENLRKISIPSSVKSIGDNAFYNCSNLETLELAEGLIEIEPMAFTLCKSLKKVKLPNSLEKLGEKAFFSCEELKSVKLSDNLTVIPDKAFADCKNLTRIKIPNGVEKIDNFAFATCLKLRSISIPNSVFNIGVGAFSGCENLLAVKLPNNLKTIEERAFYYCTKLKFIDIPESVNLIRQQAFSNCENLTHAKLSDNMILVDKFSFAHCSKLRKLDIGKSIKMIDNGAFKDTAITKIVVPKSVTKIGSNAFENCVHLKKAVINANISTLLPEVFYSCDRLSEVTLPETLRVIDRKAFAECVNLTDVNIPENVTTIGSSAFAECIKLDNITLPNKLESIGESAFAGCTALSSITIPGSVKYLHSQTFSDCISLSDVTFNEGLKTIGEEAFSTCTAITKLDLPTSLEFINKNAFRITPNMQYLFIPKSTKFESGIDGKKLKFYTKMKNGIAFSENELEGSKSMESINVGVASLCANQDYFDTVVKEQHNPNIAYFYNDFFTKLPQKERDDFLKNHNFTFFKQIAEKTPIKNKGTLTILYNLGAFEPPVEVNGKRVDIAQKVVGFLIEKVDKNKIMASTISQIGLTMDSYDFKPEFTAFFLTKFPELIEEENNQRGFIAKCFNRFEEVQATNTSNRGNQKQLKPTVEKFRDYFFDHKFEGMNTPETRSIARTIYPYFGAQTIFDEAVSIMKEKKRKNIPDHILSTPLKETPFFEIDKRSALISKESEEITNNLTSIAQNEFTYEWLAKNDPTNLILGKLCSCCSHLMGMGYGIMKAAIVHPNIQNLVIRDGSGKIIAKSTLFINPAKGYGIFNNVEISEYTIARNSYADPKILNYIYDKYLLGIKDFVEQYNKEHPELPLHQINVGMGNNDLESIIKNKHIESTDILYALNYAHFSNDMTSHRNDSSREQYILWSDHKDYLNNNETIKPSQNEDAKNSQEEVIEKQ